MTVTGKQPGTTLDRIGKSITYGITMLDNAENKEAAEAFMSYLLDPKGGMQVLESMGQPPFIPACVPGDEMYKKLPASLQSLVEIKE